MRPAPLLLVAALATMAGCVDAGIDVIEEARRERGFGVEESTGPTPDPTPPSPAVSSPRPTPRPTTPSPSAPTPSPLPTPVATPLLSPTPTLTPIPTPTPTPSTPTPTPRPTPTPASPSPVVRPWPSEGSYVRAVVDSAEGRAYLNWTYLDDGWLGTCERDGVATVRYGPDSPPHWPLFNTREVPDVGDEVKVWWAEGCALLQGEAAYDGFREGAHEAHEQGFETRWDSATGLVLTWTRIEGEGWHIGQMYATDAPLRSLS